MQKKASIFLEWDRTNPIQASHLPRILNSWIGIWHNNTKWGYLSWTHESTDDNGRGRVEQQAWRMLLTGVKAEGRPSTRNIRTWLHLEYEHHGTARSIRGVLCMWEKRKASSSAWFRALPAILCGRVETPVQEPLTIYNLFQLCHVLSRLPSLQHIFSPRAFIGF
jgi:hypothetical protein